MNAANSNHPHRRRNTVITGAAIGAVVLTGAAAVGLNLGILDAADEDNVGELAAAGDLLPGDTQVIDVYIDDSAGSGTDAATTSTPVDNVQEFLIDTAGTVSVIESADGLELGAVLANPGWTWSLADADASTLKLSFTNGTRTVVFTATLGPDGSLSAVVEEPVASEAVSPPAAPGSYGDEDEFGDDHEEEVEDEDEEHEGREDDD